MQLCLSSRIVSGRQRTEGFSCVGISFGGAIIPVRMPFDLHVRQDNSAYMPLDRLDLFLTFSLLIRIVCLLWRWIRHLILLRIWIERAIVVLWRIGIWISRDIRRWRVRVHLWIGWISHRGRWVAHRRWLWMIERGSLLFILGWLHGHHHRVLCTTKERGRIRQGVK